jgi:hypothetical protein
MSSIEAQLAELDDLLQQANREIGPPEPLSQSNATAQPDSPTAADVEPAGPEPEPPSDDAESQPSGTETTSIDDDPVTPTQPPADCASDADTRPPETDGLLEEPGQDGDDQPAQQPVSDESTGDVTDSAAGTPQGVPDFMKEFTGAADSEPADQPPPQHSPGPVPDFMQEFTQSEDQAGSDPPAASGNLDVPDFMAEFTDSEAAGAGDDDTSQQASAPPANRQEAAATPATPQPPKPGVIRSSDRSTFREYAAQPQTEPVGTETDAPARRRDAPKRAPRKKPSKRRIARLVGRLAKPIEPLALKTCERGIHVLEAIDRPTVRLGTSPRRAIGMLAIATLGTSLIVYLVSLL